MTEDNIERIRLGHESQTVSIRREGVAVRTTRPRVIDNSFGVASTLQAWTSSSHSRLSQASQAYDAEEPEDPKAPIDLESQKEDDQDAPLQSYPEGSYDTSFLYDYVEHIIRHVYNW